MNKWRVRFKATKGDMNFSVEQVIEADDPGKAINIAMKNFREAFINSQVRKDGISVALEQAYQEWQSNPNLGEFPWLS